MVKKINFMKRLADFFRIWNSNSTCLSYVALAWVYVASACLPSIALLFLIFSCPNLPPLWLTSFSSCDAIATATPLRGFGCLFLANGSSSFLFVHSYYVPPPSPFFSPRTLLPFFPFAFLLINNRHNCGFS